jgi:outer membrane protein OmpA-like peptidoglycan-associated protein
VLNIRIPRINRTGLTRNLIMATALLSALSGGAGDCHERRRGFLADQPPFGEAGGPDIFRVSALANSDREEISSIAAAKPTVDLEIPFDIDSEVLSDQAKPAVAALGKALTSRELTGTVFVIAGHTDGLESEPYSQALSELRAEAVKHELVSSFAVPAEDLVVVGYGSRSLKNSKNPFDSVNDRVQIVSMVTKAVK